MIYLIINMTYKSSFLSTVLFVNLGILVYIMFESKLTRVVVNQDINAVLLF